LTGDELKICPRKEKKRKEKKRKEKKRKEKKRKKNTHTKIDKQSSKSHSKKINIIAQSHEGAVGVEKG
jgi:hypothetical protein